MTGSPRARILLIDDDEDPANYSGWVLELQESFDVTVVNRARDVLPLIASNRGAFDAVILDIMMPSEGYAEINQTQGGLTTGALVLNDVRYVLKDIPVLVVSARSEEDARACLGPISGVVVKPASLASIIQKLTEILRPPPDAKDVSVDYVKFDALTESGQSDRTVGSNPGRAARLLASLDLVPEFLGRLRHHWAAAMMGGTAPGIGLFLWALLGSPPHWSVGLILVGALLFSAYFAWRDEHLARKESVYSLRLEGNGAVSTRSVGGGAELNIWAEFNVSLFNAGAPSIAKDWGLRLPNGYTIRMLEHDPIEAEHNPARRRLIQNVKDVSEIPLQTGARKELYLEFRERLLPEHDREAQKPGPRWTLLFKDVAGAVHTLEFARKEGPPSTDGTPEIAEAS